MAKREPNPTEDLPSIDGGPNAASVAGAELRQFLERIERLEEEKRTLSDDVKEVFAEAKGRGFDTKIMRQIVRIRRMDANERKEQEAIRELYLNALGME